YSWVKIESPDGAHVPVPVHFNTGGKRVLIRLGYDIQFDIPFPVAMLALLHVHPSRMHDLVEPDLLDVQPNVRVEQYRDCFGNLCSRFLAPAGHLTLTGSTLIEDSGEIDEADPNASQAPVDELPTEVLQFLLASRYCEVDRLGNTAQDLFGNTPPGWARV